MSDLTTTRDYARTMAGRSETSPRDAALWLQIAEEIDAYLAGPAVVEDLFGEVGVEPEYAPAEETA